MNTIDSSRFESDNNHAVFYFIRHASSKSIILLFDKIKINILPTA
jgi:hypothetical protein